MRVPLFAALVPAVVFALAAPFVAAADGPLVIQVPPAPPGPEVGPDSAFRVAGLSFTPDSSKLVTTANGHVAIWDLATGKPVFELTEGKAKKVYGWTAQDGRVLYVREDAKYTRRDPATGAEIEQVRQIPTGQVSPDGTLFTTVIGLGDGLMPVAPPAQGKRPAAKPAARAPAQPAAPRKQGAGPPVRQQPSNRPPAKASKPKKEKPLTPEQQEKLDNDRRDMQRLFPNRDNAKLPGDDNKVNDGGKDKDGGANPRAKDPRAANDRVYVRDAKTGAIKATLITDRFHPDEGEPRGASKVGATAFSPDSSRVAAVLDDGTLNVWDVPGDPNPLIIETGLDHFEGSVPGPEGTIAWTADGSKVVLVSGGTVVVADPANKAASTLPLVGGGDLLPGEPEPAKEDGAFPPPHMGGGTPSADSGESEGRLLVAPDLSRVVEFRRLWPEESRSMHEDFSSRIAVYRAAGDGYDVVGRISGPDHEPITTAVFSPDSSRLALETIHGTVYVYSVAELDSAASERSKLSAANTGDLKVPNPLYLSWDGIAPGTRVEFERSRSINGNTQTWTEVVLLEERDESLGLTTRTFDKDKGPPRGDPGDVQPNLSKFDIPSRVSPSEAAKQQSMPPGDEGFKKAGGKQPVKVGDRTFQCDVYVRTPEQSGGVTQKTKYWVSPDAPGLVVKYEDEFEGPNGKSHETKVMSAIVPK